MSQQVNVYRTLEFFQTTSTTCARMLAGDSTTALAYTAGTPPMALYYTSANTSATNAEPIYIKSTMTGANGYGGRCRYHAYTNVRLGSNFMALKAQAEFGSAGSCAGLSAALCAELVMPNVAIAGGTYYVLELEYVAGGSSLVTNPQGTQAGFIYMAQSGDADGDFDDNGYLFYLNGCAADSGHLYDTSASAATGDATLKINIGGATKYLLVADDAS